MSQKKDTSFAAKLVHSKILIGLIIIGTGYTIVVNLISLIAGKQTIIVKIGNVSFNMLSDNLLYGGSTSSIILFVSGIVLITARIFYILAHRWYKKLANKYQE